MCPILHVFIGDLVGVSDAVIKMAALFLTATVLFRFGERRTLGIRPVRLDRGCRRRIHRRAKDRGLIDRPPDRTGR